MSFMIISEYFMTHFQFVYLVYFEIVLFLEFLPFCLSSLTVLIHMLTYCNNCVSDKQYDRTETVKHHHKNDHKRVI